MNKLIIEFSFYKITFKNISPETEVFNTRYESIVYVGNEFRKNLNKHFVV